MKPDWFRITQGIIYFPTEFYGVSAALNHLLVVRQVVRTKR